MANEKPPAEDQKPPTLAFIDLLVHVLSGGVTEVDFGPIPVLDPPFLGDSAVDDSESTAPDDQGYGMGRELPAAGQTERRAQRNAERFSYELHALLESARYTRDLSGAQWFAAQLRKLEEQYFPQPGPDAGAGDPGDIHTWIDEVGAAYEELMREYAQSPAPQGDPPAGWRRMWWWASIFGIEPWIDSYLRGQRKATGIREPVEPMGDEELPDQSGIQDLNLSPRDRLDTLLWLTQALDPAGEIAKSDPGYRISRAAANFLSGGGTFEDIDRRFRGDGEPVVADGHLDGLDPYQPGRIDQLLADFEQGQLSPGDLTATWITAWGWAHVFGVEDELNELLEQRRHLLGIALIERPTAEQLKQFLAEAGASEVTGEQPPLLYAIINQYERIEPTPATDSPREYLAIRDFAVGSSGLTLDDINRALRGLPPLAADEDATTAPVDPPTMTVPDEDSSQMDLPPSLIDEPEVPLPPVAPPTMEVPPTADATEGGRTADQDTPGAVNADAIKAEVDKQLTAGTPTQIPLFDDDPPVTRAALQEQARQIGENLDRASNFDHLLREFDQSRAAGVDRPAGWMRIWWWAYLFGVEREIDQHIEEQSRVAWVPMQTPSTDELFGESGAPFTALSPLERVIASIIFGEALAEAEKVTVPREYDVVREIAIEQYPTVPLIVQSLREIGLREPAEPSPGGTVGLGSDGRPQVTIDARHLTVEDKFMDRAGVDFDLDLEDPPPDDDQLIVPELKLDPDPREGLDSGPDDSDGVMPLSDARQPGDSTGRGLLGSPRRRVATGVAVLLVLATVAAVALTGGGQETGEPVASEPSAVPPGATAAVVSPDAPAEATTEQPTMQIAPVADLVICASNPDESFNGFRQPDGTYLDAETGEPRGCPGD